MTLTLISLKRILLQEHETHIHKANHWHLFLFFLVNAVDEDKCLENEIIYEEWHYLIRL